MKLKNNLHILNSLRLAMITLLIAAAIGFTAAGDENNNLVSTTQEVNIINPVKSAAEEISGITSFSHAVLFEARSENAVLKGGLRNYSALHLKSDAVKELLLNKPASLELTLPLKNGENMILQLMENVLRTDDFKMIKKSTSGEETVNVNTNGQLHYRGVIKGKPNSIAAISVFEGSVMGVISDENGNYVLGPVNTDPAHKKLAAKTNEYVFYNESDLVKKNDFICRTEDMLDRSTFKTYPISNIQSNGEPGLNPVTAVKVYFVCDYDMYQAAGGNLTVLSNYVNGIFNSVKTMYQNEQIDMLISTIQVYTSPDPMSFYDDSYQIRQVFGAQIQNNMQGGHIAHLLSTRDIGAGGIAYIRSLCQQYDPSDSSGSYAYSNIETTYQPYPTYSFTTLVVTHEMGHNIGSRHTHACVWPINNTIRSIDTCTINGENENCFPPNFQPRPAKGTIMSYCHFWQNQPPYGTNLALGFGPLPGDTIRLRYAQAQACLTIGIQQTGIEIPADYTLMQNYPNPFNPTTNINFALPSAGSVKLTVFDVTGRTLAVLVDSKLNAGSYSFDWDASNYTSGVYLYKLEFNGSASGFSFTETKKMVLIK
jgi:hypothetical protein